MVTRFITTPTKLIRQFIVTCSVASGGNVITRTVAMAWTAANSRFNRTMYEAAKAAAHRSFREIL